MNVIQEINQLGSDAIFCPLDVQIKCQIEEVIDNAFATFGSFDVMINNTGICIVNSLDDIKEDELEKQWGGGREC